MRRAIHSILGGLALLFSAVALAQEFPKAETLEVTEVVGNYVLKVPVSSLIMTIPKGGLVPAHNPLGGGAGSPRYFYFKDEGRSLVITGWFEPQEAYKGIQQLWAEDSATFKHQGLPEPEDVSFVEVGKWSVVFYDHRLKGMRSSHLRAEWVQAGTWIDIHLSVTGTLSRAEQRAKLRDVLNTIQVSEKTFGISVAGKSGATKPKRAEANQGARTIYLGGGEEDSAGGPSESGPHRTYTVPGHGKFSVDVPNQWRVLSKPQQSPPALHLRFRPPGGDAFFVQITAVWLDAEKCANLTPDKLKDNVLKSSAAPLKSAVEKEAKLKELRGDQTIGYYYSLTDRNPPPDEYKYMTQGIARTGEMMVIFTILQREDSAAVRTAALQMLAHASYSK